MARKMKLKHVVVYENILVEINVRHCGIKVKAAIEKDTKYISHAVHIYCMQIIECAFLIVQAHWSPFRPKQKPNWQSKRLGLVIYIIYV